MIKWLINFLIFFILVIIYFLYKKEKNKNKDIQKINEKIKLENEKIYNDNEKLIEKQKIINTIYEQKQEELNNIQKTIESSENISKKAFENYVDILEKNYEEKEQEYQDAIKLLYNSYDTIQNQININIDKEKEKLEKIAATRAAAIQAQLREEEIKEQSDFYSLSLDILDKKEIKILNSIESEFRDSRPIKMIIWTSYYSKKANELFSRVLKTEEVCGIYKITNKINNMSYIGQSVDIRKRWRDHMKCGLGIDTPVNNKLYQDMIEKGIENFTFELLENCSLNELDDKEAFYISLYNSKNYGYNSTSGNKKG